MLFFLFFKLTKTAWLSLVISLETSSTGVPIFTIGNGFPITSRIGLSAVFLSVIKLWNKSDSSTEPTNPFTSTT